MRTLLSTFLDAERRQVWALRRETGEPFFLPEGQAVALRDFTKSSLRCTHPDCTVPISTRGGTKRDHFFHVSSPGHETGRESEFHLAGKAMLAHWAASRIPDGATVREEHTVKDPDTQLLRRADVMVTGRSGRQVAFEVEYKAYAVDAWRAKQADYNAQGIECVWLIGHTKVRLATSPSYLVGLGETAVRVPELAAEIARAGHPLVVINPVTRQVGTLANNPWFGARYHGNDHSAWMAVDDLADCEFSPRGGIITPALRRIAVAEDEAARERAEHEALLARENEARQEMRQRIVGYEAEYQRVWQASELRAEFIAQWGKVPELLKADPGTSWGVWATSAHWHGVIYDELLADRTDDFKWRDVFDALDRHNIRRHHDSKVAFRAVIGWLESMERLGLLRIHRDGQRRVLLFSPSGLTLDAAIAQQGERAAQKAAEKVQAEAETMRSAERERAAHDARSAELDDRRRTRLVILEDGTRRWVRKEGS